MGKRPKFHSRTMVIKADTGRERDILLRLASPMISEIGARMSSSLNRIEFEIIGEYDEVDKVIGQLRSLENMVFAATHPDKDGLYYYHANLLTKLCPPPVNLDLYASALGVTGYLSEVVSDQLKSKATLETIELVHDQIIRLRNQIVDDLNRDVERFVISLALEMESTTIDDIMAVAVDHGVLDWNEYGYNLTMTSRKAREKVLHHLGELPEDLGEVDTGDFSLAEFGFDGGKVVFIKDGQELDEPPFDDSPDSQ